MPLEYLKITVQIESFTAFANKKGFFMWEIHLFSITVVYDSLKNYNSQQSKAILH